MIPGAAMIPTVGRALVVPPSSPAAIERTRALEAALLQCPQVEIRTQHVIHAGMYARTIVVPAGVVLTGALVKRATLLIVNGHCRMTTDDGVVDLQGFAVLPASAGRKQAFRAFADTHLTMLFPTAARTVEECEREFTDDADLLMSRHGYNDVLITGE